MGYETYLVEIRLNNINDKKAFIDSLRKKQFVLIKSDNAQYLEKRYTLGIVEICVTDTLMTFRYAKPNLCAGLLEFLKELQELSQMYEFRLFDVRQKKEYTAEYFVEIIEDFEISRAEFIKYFPDRAYPVRSNDVFKKNK